MKRNNLSFLFICILIVIILINLTYAGDIGLIYSEQWSWNLTGSSSANGAVFGDIDNDGDLDMISIGCASGVPCTVADKSYVYINNGTSLIEDLTWEQNLSGVGSGSVALGDIDNDGDLDLVFAGSGTINTKIYTNNGTTFTENSIWQDIAIANDAGSGSVALGDIDNDGDLDLIFTGMGTPSDVVYLNNGTGFINNSIWSQEITSEGKISSGLVDLDNDGDLDLNIMGTSSAKSYINNGTSFVYDGNWNTVGHDEGNVAWGDLDNDGDFDYASSGGANFIFGINNGSEFIDGSSWDFDLSNLEWGSMMFGDYDNNGSLDLVSSGKSGGSSITEIGSNNGTTFEADVTAQANLTGERKSSAIWGDIDNDGDLDLVVIKSQKVYINNITTPNSAPTPPASFSSSYNNREIKLGWGNGSDAETISTGLYYNLMIGNSSANHTIISGIYGGSGDATRGGTAFGYFGNMMQRKNFTLKVDRLQASTTYYWYVQTIDTALKAGNWSTVQSFNTPADMDRPSITLNSPVNNYNSSSYTITFNVTVTDNINLSNVSLWGNWSGWHLNETNASGINATYIFTKDLTAYGDGTYTWQIEAKDNATNIQNSSIRIFTIDTTSPNINITSPINNTNSTDNTLDVNYTISDANLQACWYSNDTYSGNQTLSNCDNITSVTWNEGQHNVTVYVNDSFGNINETSVTFTIDSIVPNINLIYPANNTSYTDNTLDINYTVSDTNLDSCWYSNDTYSGNQTLSSCDNITSVTWTDGQHNVTIWANDSFGNINNSEITFRIDTIAPDLNITTPINNTNSTDNTLDIEYTVSDANLQACWYSNDTYSSNETLTCGNNITSVIWSEGQHNLTIWANDTVGNKSSFFVRFTIDSIAPNINITTPSNNTNSTDNLLDVNYTVSDANLQACWYSNDTYAGNESITCGTNISITWTEGQHNVTIWANDSFGNENSSSVRFKTDTNAPIINLISPANSATWSSSSTVTFSYNVTDVDIANCSLIIDSSVDQTDITIDEDTIQSFTKTLSNADYTWSVNCTDYVNFKNNSDTRSLTVSYTSSNGNTGGGGSTTTSFWKLTSKVNDEQFKQGYTKELSVRQRIKISVNNTSHYIGVIKLTNKSMTINVTSEPQQAILLINQTKKFELTNDTFYDLLIRLNNITENKANLTILKIHEEIVEIEEKVEEKIEDKEIETEEKKKEELAEEKGKLWILVIVVVVIILVLTFLKKYLKYRRWKKWTLLG
jgi:hypothetical protein